MRSSLRRGLSTSAAAGLPSAHETRNIVDPKLFGPLSRVSGLVTRSLMDLETLRAESSPWTSGFESLINICRSPRLHLFRPQLVMLGAQAHGLSLQPDDEARTSSVEKFSAGIELQHVFMLVHDDVADHGTLRRGLPTVSVALSQGGLLRAEKTPHLANCIGDVVHAKAMELIFESAFELAAPGAARAVLEAACRAGAAQFDDIVGFDGVERAVRGSSGLSLSFLRDRHALDIAAHHGFVAPLLAGLHLGKPDEQRWEKGLRETCVRWGEHAGKAFSALDDVADLVLDASETGKDALQDVREGRLSQPLFALKRLASDEEWRQIAAILGSGLGSTMTLYDRRVILEAIARHRLVERTLDEAKLELAAAGEAAEKVIEPLRPGLKWFVRALQHELQRLEAKARAKNEAQAKARAAKAKSAAH